MHNHKGERAGREGAKDAEDSLREVEAHQVEGGEIGTVDEVGGQDLFRVGTVSHNPLRMRGGGQEGNSDEESTKEPPQKKSPTSESLFIDKDVTDELLNSPTSTNKAGGETLASEVTGLATSAAGNRDWSGMVKGDSGENEEDKEHYSPKQKRVRKETSLHARPYGWTQEEYNTKAQRLGPLEQPRMPDKQWGNMTIDAIGDGEDLYFAPLSKEYYRRTDEQTRAVKEAQEDQRKVGGGVYGDKANQRQFLTIRKGFASKDIGLKLELVDGRQKELIFDVFAAMQYEFFHFSNESPVRRIRLKQPQETSTGYIWYGFGTDLNIPQSDIPRGKVYAFCERVGDLHLHFSGALCERVTEAPGASQLLCRNEGCGVVAWHFSMKTFECDNSQWEEATQDDFALVVFKGKHGRKELVWTCSKKGGSQTRRYFDRLESSLQYDAVRVDPGTRERLSNFLRGRHLPHFQFSPPTYAPKVARWRDQPVLMRLSSNSDWCDKCISFIVHFIKIFLCTIEDQNNSSTTIHL